MKGNLVMTMTANTTMST